MTCSRSLVALVLVLASAGAAPAEVSSSFDGDAQGWSVRDVNCSNYAQVLATHGVTWEAAGGDPDGHVVHHDGTTYCSFFVAPAEYLGDQSASAGGRLEFSLYSTEHDWVDSDFVVLIGGGLVIRQELPNLPPQPPAWQHYVIELEAAEFTTASGAPVSPNDLVAVLADLEGLLLPAEFGAQIEETVGLDSVRLIPRGIPVPDTPASAGLRLDGYPNPFNPRTTLSFTLPSAGHAVVAIHDARGMEVARLLDGSLDAGPHSVSWDGRDTFGAAMPSGTYFCGLRTPAGGQTRKLQLIR